MGWALLESPSVCTEGSTIVISTIWIGLTQKMDDVFLSQGFFRRSFSTLQKQQKGFCSPASKLFSRDNKDRQWFLSVATRGLFFCYWPLLASLSRILISRKPLRTPLDNRRTTTKLRRFTVHFNNAGQEKKMEHYKIAAADGLNPRNSMPAAFDYNRFSSDFMWLSSQQLHILGAGVFVFLRWNVRRFARKERTLMGESRRHRPLQHFCRLSLTGKPRNWHSSGQQKREQTMQSY